MRPYLPALTRHQAVVLIPRQTLTLELGKAYCLQDVFISYYTGINNAPR